MDPAVHADLVRVLALATDWAARTDGRPPTAAALPGLAKGVKRDCV